MRLALDAARQVSDSDVPVGAVVLTATGQVIAQAANQRQATDDPFAHAEMLALSQASQALGSWRMDDCTLVVTLEPCAMCAGAISQTRLQRLVFGAYDPKAGAVSSLFDLLRDPRLPHRVEVIAGVLETDCQAILRDFFEDKRSS